MRPLRLILRSIVWVITLLALRLAAASGVDSASADAFPKALADLRAERAKTAVTGTTVVHRTEANEAFFSRIDLGSLGPKEIAAIVRLNAFAYGDKAHALAAVAIERLTPMAAAPDADGALAAASRVQLSGHAKIASATRAEWAGQYLHHPAVAALLQGEFGDLALEVACSSVRTDADRELVLGLADRLKATRSPAAALALVPYWNKIQRWVPEGERRQALRSRLADFLAAALASGKDDPLIIERHDLLSNQLALLNGAEARGRLQGGAAPEIHFAWSSRNEWKALSDLRGKVVVLDFWATWCGQCIESFPSMAKLAARYRGFDVEIVGVTSVQGAIFGLHAGPSIDCRGDPEKEMRLMAEYIKERGITWPVVFSREPVINPDYGLRGIPTVVIIAPDGTVRHKSEGVSEAEDIAQIDALLAEFRLRVPARTPTR